MKANSAASFLAIMSCTAEISITKLLSMTRHDNCQLTHRPTQSSREHKTTHNISMTKVCQKPCRSTLFKLYFIQGSAYCIYYNKQGLMEGLAGSDLYLLPGWFGKSFRGGILSLTWSRPLASANPLILWFGLKTCPCRAKWNKGKKTIILSSPTVIII